MPPETRDAPAEAPSVSDRIAPALDDYRMPTPSVGTDPSFRADNDRYMVRLGFPGAESLLGPDALLATRLDNGASAGPTSADSLVRKTSGPAASGDGPVKEDPAKKPESLKDFDPACVARHAGTSPRPLSLMVELAGTDKHLPLTTWPVATGRAADERILATAAHGFVRMPHEHSFAEHKILDEGFKSLDFDKSGTLSREEVAEALKKEQERERTYTPPKEREVGEPIGVRDAAHSGVSTFSRPNKVRPG